MTNNANRLTDYQVFDHVLKEIQTGDEVTKEYHDVLNQVLGSRIKTHEQIFSGILISRDRDGIKKLANAFRKLYSL